MIFPRGPVVTRASAVLSATCLAGIACLAACAPQPGTGITEDVIEIEEIEMAPRPTEPVSPDSGMEARRAVDAEKAAADRAIDEAAQSIEPPPSASPGSPAAAAPDDSQRDAGESETTADQ